MKKLTINTKTFLKWYFETGSDQEQEREYKDLGETVADELIRDGVSVTIPQDIFDRVEHAVIPFHLTNEGAGAELDIEIGEAVREFQLKLIKN